MGLSPLLAVAILVLARSEAFLAPRGSVPVTASTRAAPVTFRGTSVCHRYDTRSVRMSAIALPGVEAGAATATPAVAAPPSVRPPPQMYQNAVDIGEKKAAAPAAKTFLMGIISGCHIGFGALLAVSVGGNCPGLLATNPGLQKIIFGAFGKSRFRETSLLIATEWAREARGKERIGRPIHFATREKHPLTKYSEALCARRASEAVLITAAGLFNVDYLDKVRRVFSLLTDVHRSRCVFKSILLLRYESRPRCFPSVHI